MAGPYPSNGVIIGGGTIRMSRTADASADETVLGGDSRVAGGMLRSRWPLNPKDYGAVGDGTTHPLSGYYASLAAARVVYPHATALTNEIDWAATQLCLDMAETTRQSVHSPAGVFLTDQTFNVPSGVVWNGQGGCAGVGGSRTEFKATTVGMLVIKMQSLSKISDIGVNGDYKAAWGIMGLGLKDSLWKVFVTSCTKNGITLASTQNAVLIEPTIYYCENALVLLNGARNNVIVGISTASTETWYGGDYSQTKGVLYKIITTDPSGFGYPVVLSQPGGNDRNHFYGGIIENHCFGIVAEDDGLSGLTVIHQRSSYDGVEFSIGSDESSVPIKLIPAFSGEIHFNSCQLGWNGAAYPLASGPSPCRLLFTGSTLLNGGSDLVLRGCTDVPTNLLQTLNLDMSDEVNPVLGSSGSEFVLSGATGVFGSDKKWTLTRTGSVGLLSCGPRGILGGQAPSAVANTMHNTAVLIRARFVIHSITGGTTICASAAYSVAPWRRALQDCGVGPHDITFLATGLESGGIDFTFTCTSVVISSLKLEYA